MKKILIASGAVLLCIATSVSHAVIIAEDAYNVGGTNEYTLGAIAGQGPTAVGSGWGPSNNNAWNIDTISSGGLRFVGTEATDLTSYSDGTLSTVGVNGGSAGSVSIQSTGSGFGTSSRSFTSSDVTGASNELYFSFNTSFASAPSTSFGIRLIDDAGSARYDIRRGTATDSIRIGSNIFDGGSTIFGTDSTLDWTTVSFMVGRITGVGTSNTTFDLWVNPSDLSDIAGDATIATVNTTTATSSGIAGFQLGYASGDDGSVASPTQVRLVF